MGNWVMPGPNDLGGLLFNSLKRPNRVAGSEGRINTSVSDFDPNAERSLTKDGWQDPGNLQFGNAVRSDGSVRGWPNMVEDISLFKDTPFSDRFRASAGGSVREHLQPHHLVRRKQQLEFRRISARCRRSATSPVRFSSGRS